MHGLCMATKTISLELDAYEKLRALKLPGESFSAVVRRLQPPSKTVTSAGLLGLVRRRGPILTETDCDSIDRLNADDLPPEIP
jgi:hypothetical protein